MKDGGDVFVGIIILIVILGIVGLYIVNLEGSVLSIASTSPVNGIGSDTYLILAAAPVLLVLFAIYRFIKSSDSLSFGGG